MAIKLKFGEPAQREHFSKNDDIWDLDLKFRLEHECILEELRSRANENQPGDWNRLETVIKDTYAVEDDPSKPGAWALEQAISGYFKKNAPTESSIRMWLIAFLIAVLAEISVLLVQGLLSTDFNPFLIVLAIILGLGGYLQGRGIGSKFFHNWLHDIKQATPVRHQEWLLIVIGTLLILLVSLFRAYGSDENIQFLIVFCITFFFGEAVAVLKAMHEKQMEQREWCLVRQGEAQTVRANRRHLELYKNGSYEKYYGHPTTKNLSEKLGSEIIKE